MGLSFRKPYWYGFRVCCTWPAASAADSIPANVQAIHDTLRGTSGIEEPRPRPRRRQRHAITDHLPLNIAEAEAEGLPLTCHVSSNPDTLPSPLHHAALALSYAASGRALR